MTPARFIRPGSTFYVTVRAVNRSFRFVPSRRVSKAIRFSLAAKLQEYRKRNKLVLHDFMFMSNHYHLLLTDFAACVPDFLRDLNSLISRELNALRGIRGTNFEDQPGIVEILGDDRVIEHAVYTGANPVAAFLVAKARHWRGVSSVGMRYGVPVVVNKPKLGMWAGKQAHRGRASSKRSGRAAYADRSVLPKTAELVIDRPRVHLELSDDELRDLIEARLQAREEEVAAERVRRKIGVVGRKEVERIHYLAIPGSEEMFARRPSVSSADPAARVAYLALRAAFLQAYAAAREAFRARLPGVVFPYGTYMMRAIHKQRCAPAPSG